MSPKKLGAKFIGASASLAMLLQACAPSEAQQIGASRIKTLEGGKIAANNVHGPVYFVLQDTKTKRHYLVVGDSIQQLD